jgi:UPF0755 protein
MFTKKSRFLKPGWLILFIIIIILFVKIISFWSFIFSEKIVIEKWDTIEKFTDKLSTLSNIRVRWYIKNNPDKLKSLQLWSYEFSGSYTPDTFVDAVSAGPSRSFTKIRLLEWRSIYDIDEYLTKQWYISWWEYIEYVSEINNIQSLSEKFDFIKLFSETKPQNNTKLTLEWLLYPDTYHLSNNQPIIPQLVSLQLQAFRDKVFDPLSNDINSFSISLQSQWYSFSLWFYNIITLASIVEKEERSNKNKPLIAGIFMNRIENNMRIDADITLCYGLQKWYEICTPSLIVQSINDENNIYNTRKKYWLTPTPIANPSVNTIESVLNFKKTNNLFYLHDSNGLIWTADSLEWHNDNKNKHL